MKPIFTSSGYTPFDILALDNGSTLHLNELPAFLRVLLTTDGTVTKSLESFFWEPVTVHKLDQHREALTEDAPAIGKKQGDEVILRRVRLQGEKSANEYARAFSFICPDALPASICRDLELDRVGIGELLRECGLETYRELMTLGRVELDGETYITRTYRIIMGNKPFIQITEKFPLALYSFSSP